MLESIHSPADVKQLNMAQTLSLIHIVRREMIVGGRKFFVRSIFSTAEKAKTPTEQMLQIIDSDLGKGSI